MSEYATYGNSEIYIGSCESLDYLRPDQISLVTSEAISTTSLPHLRFRFPYPHEDERKPGEFPDDRNAGFGVSLYAAPKGIDHYKVQFRAGNPRGILVSLPCPMSEAGDAFTAATGISVHFNGFGPAVSIVAQRVWEGVWATVLRCNPCGALFRLPTINEALPLIEAMTAMAKDQLSLNPGSAYAEIIMETAERVMQGYRTAAPTTI